MCNFCLVKPHGTSCRRRRSRTNHRSGSSKNTDTDYFHEGGSYLPLKAWELKGWDTEKIVKNSDPEGIDEHPKYGTLYRVRVMAKGTNKANLTETKLELLASSRKRALRRSVSGEEAKPMPSLEDLAPAPSEPKEHMPDAPKAKKATSTRSGPFLASI